MSYSPTYKKKHFVNGSEPPLNAENLNEIEEAIESAEEALSKFEVTPLYDGTEDPDAEFIATITEPDGTHKSIYAPPRTGVSSNRIGFEPESTEGNKIGDFIINGVYIPAYTGHLFYKVIDVELTGEGSITINTGYLYSLGYSLLQYTTDNPTLYPKVYEYDEENQLLTIGGFSAELVHLVVFAWR